MCLFVNSQRTERPGTDEKTSLLTCKKEVIAGKAVSDLDIIKSFTIAFCVIVSEVTSSGGCLFPYSLTKALF